LPQSTNQTILFILPSLTFGGVEKFALEYASSLKKGGFNPVVIGLGKNGPLATLLFERGIEHEAFQLRFYAGQSKRSFLANTFKFYQKTAKWQAAVWVGASYWCNIVVGLVGPWRRAEKRIWSQRSVDTGIFKGRMERMAQMGITHYSANGLAPLKHIVERHGLAESDVHVLTNVLEKELFFCTPKEVVSPPKTCFRILMAANYFPEKLQSMAIEAVRQVRDVRPDIPLRLDLLGTAPGGNYVEQNKALAFDLDLSGCVFFHTDNQEKVRLFQQADIGLLATLSEGYSNSIVEYMAHGLPVLASDILANRDVLGDEFPAAFFLNTKLALANAIIALYDNPDLQLAMGQSNQIRARARHIFDPAQQWPF
jgi:glycosyltransferase involved in cell wall biosynthesis